MATRNSQIPWNTVFGGLILVFISLALTAVFEFANGRWRDREERKIPSPEITLAGIQANIGKQDSILEETELINKVKIYSESLETPSFIMNSKRLTNFLEKNAVEITITGQLSEAYLYVRTGPIDIENESVYFWIVNNRDDGGHLFVPSSLASGIGNEFLYDLEELPIVQLPYTTKKTPKTVNVVDNYLNKDLPGKSQRKYYVGAFVSTTKLPNRINELEIRYKCKSGSNCSIVVTN